MPADFRRDIPRTDAVMADPALADALARFDRRVVKRAVEQAQALARDGAIAPAAVAARAAAALPRAPTSLRRVLNATGIVVHTNLGRAPLSAGARAALQTAAGYTDVEFDLATGRRGPRGAALRAALRAAVPAASDAHVVTNGAAALLLCVTALAAGREVIVSRGELVEIGDGFRLPDLLVTTGARLVEVGTTNRTSVGDYAAAVGPLTGAVLKVHPSNFRIQGFTAAAGVAQLAGLGPPVVVDIGSGLLRADPGLPDEPDAQRTLAAGAAVVTASADKLFGGPQAGFILGQTSCVEQARRHPLARALRVDKLTLAALEATLLDPEPPVARALHASAESLAARADDLVRQLVTAGVPAEPVATTGFVGGGGAAGVQLPGGGVAVDAALAPVLRVQDPAVIGRVTADRLVLDLRAVAPEDDAVLAAALQAASVPADRG